MKKQDHSAPKKQFHVPQMTSPTQRSLELLRSQGFLAAITEHWNKFAGIRQDLWGFGDLIAAGHGQHLIVQTTSAANIAARVAKIQTCEHCAAGSAIRDKHYHLITVEKDGKRKKKTVLCIPSAAAEWLSAPSAKIYVHGWKQKRNKWLPKGKGEWTARIVEITAS